MKSGEMIRLWLAVKNIFIRDLARERDVSGSSPDARAMYPQTDIDRLNAAIRIKNENIERRIAGAVKAERERCASVAKEYFRGDQISGLLALILNPEESK